VAYRIEECKERLASRDAARRLERLYRRKTSLGASYDKVWEVVQQESLLTS